MAPSQDDAVYVLGGDDNDTISTGNGDDFITGNGGVDTCAGGLGSNAVDCEVAAHCTAACCATDSCGELPPEDGACGAAYSQSACLTYVQGTIVEQGGHNWVCSNGNCSNCATFASCAPGGSGCPWGEVWTDAGVCN